MNNIILRQQEKRINSLLFFIILILIVFDTSRSSLLGEEHVIFKFLSYFKEVILLYFLVICLFFKNNKKNVINIFFVFYIISFGFLLIMMNKVMLGSKINEIYNYILFFLWFYVFQNLHNLTNFSYPEVFKIIEKATIVLFIITIIYVFFFSSRLMYIYQNRVAIGNPSVTSMIYVLLFGYYLILSKYNIPKTNMKVLFWMILTFLTLTSTGIASIVVLFLLSLFFFNKIKFKSILYFFLVVLFVYILIYYIPFGDSKLGSAIKYARFRIDNLVDVFLYKMGFVSKLKSPSFSIREEQWASVLKDSTWYELILGYGPRGYFQFSSHMENQYKAILVNYGIIGLVLFLVVPLSYVFKMYHKSKFHFDLSIMLVVIWFLYSFTLETLTLFSSVSLFSLAALYFYNLEFNKLCMKKLL